MENESLIRNMTLDRTLPGKAIALSRIFLYTVIAIIVSAIVWAGLTHVDVVVDARGKVIVEGESLKIGIPETGIAADVPIAVGDHVVAGQTLLRLDSYRLDAVEASLTIDVNAAQQDVSIRRAQTLIPSGENMQAAQQQLLSAQGRLRSLQEQIASLRQARQKLTLKAPVAGVVTHLAATHAGANVSIDQPAVVLMPDKLPLIADIRIPNNSMRRLRTGQTVHVTFDAFPREDYGEVTGKLQKIDPDADDQGFFDARVALDKLNLHGPAGSEPLRPGLQLNAKILVERPSLLMLILNPLRKLSQPMTVGTLFSHQ